MAADRVRFSMLKLALVAAATVVHPALASARAQRVAAMPSERAADMQRDSSTAASMLQGKVATGDFDVFLCHNSEDKLAVREIAQKLFEENLSPWPIFRLINSITSTAIGILERVLRRDTFHFYRFVVPLPLVQRSDLFKRLHQNALRHIWRGM